jgi:glutamate 5-kinase
MVGVTAVDGDFAEGDIIDIMNEKGEVIALGRSAYSAEEAKKFIGKHEIKPIVHYDYLYIK